MPPICRLNNYEGPLDYDTQEVKFLEWVSLKQLRQDTAANRDYYTPWLLEEMQRMRWLEDANLSNVNHTNQHSHQLSAQV